MAFDFDISDSEPSTASKIPKPRDRNRLIASKSPLDEAKENNKVALLTLPIEIRLLIYDLLVVSCSDRTGSSSWAIRHTDEKLIEPFIGHDGLLRRMEPGILQTCKQIYHEANSILYSQNEFASSDPVDMLIFIGQIGLVNLKLVKRLHLWVPSMVELSPWLKLLHLLAEEASGLRYIGLAWCADFELSWQLPRGARERGFGDNLDFVRALGKIRGLENLVIAGYYAKNWPAYLEERMGVRVRAIRGHCREECELKRGDLNAEELKMQRFMEYQRGTEDLIP